MRLEFGMKLVLACFFLTTSVLYGDERPKVFAYSLVPLKQYNPPTLVSSRQVVAGVIKLDGRNYVG